MCIKIKVNFVVSAGRGIRLLPMLVVGDALANDTFSRLSLGFERVEDSRAVAKDPPPPKPTCPLIEPATPVDQDYEVEVTFTSKILCITPSQYNKYNNGTN